MYINVHKYTRAKATIQLLHFLRALSSSALLYGLICRDLTLNPRRWSLEFSIIESQFIKFQFFFTPKFIQHCCLVETNASRMKIEVKKNDVRKV